MSNIEIKTLPEITLNLAQRWSFVFRSRNFTDQLRMRYGEIVLLNIGKDHTFMALSPEGSRQVLSANPKIYDAFWKESFTGITGPGSIWVLGPKAHQRERQVLAPAFHPQYHRQYGEKIIEITRQKTSHWVSGQVIKAQETTMEISLEVIQRFVLGLEDGEWMRQGHQKLKGLWRTLPPLGVFFPEIQKSWFPPWAKYLRAKRKFSDWILSYISLRREERSEAKDVLGRLLASRYEDGQLMRDEDIRDEMITILAAGMETTATALAWALFDLAGHPDVLEKVRREIESLGLNPDSGLIVNLPYLSAVCNETLRLHTLLPEVARVLVEPLDFFGHTLPVGSSVTISMMAIHHDPDLYPEPDRYRPERFIERTYSPYEFLPFGGGHRRCLGGSLSDYEMRLVIAEIVMNWEFEIAAQDHEIRHDIAMAPKNRIPLRILGRRANKKIDTKEESEEILSQEYA